MLFGTFDFVILAIIVLFNFGVWKYKIIRKRNWILYLIVIFCCGFIIPFFSIGFEIDQATKDQEIIDSFTLLYTYFRFPTWWLIGCLEILILKKIIK